MYLSVYDKWTQLLIHDGNNKVEQLLKNWRAKHDNEQITNSINKLQF